MITLIALARWRRLQSTEATASLRASASGPRYRLAEKIGFASVVPALGWGAFQFMLPNLGGAP